MILTWSSSNLPLIVAIVHFLHGFFSRICPFPTFWFYPRWGLAFSNALYSISQEICIRFLHCCHLLWLYIDWFSHIHQAYFWVALWQSNDCPSASKQPWWIWINTSCEFIMNDCITTTKQSTTKTCEYFLGYTVLYCSQIWHRSSLKQLHKETPSLHDHN